MKIIVKKIKDSDTGHISYFFLDEAGNYASGCFGVQNDKVYDLMTGECLDSLWLQN